MYRAEGILLCGFVKGRRWSEWIIKINQIPPQRLLIEARRLNSAQEANAVLSLKQLLIKGS